MECLQNALGWPQCPAGEKAALECATSRQLEGATLIGGDAPVDEDFKVNPTVLGLSDRSLVRGHWRVFAHRAGATICRTGTPPCCIK